MTNDKNTLDERESSDLLIAAGIYDMIFQSAPNGLITFMVTVAKRSNPSAKHIPVLREKHLGVKQDGELVGEVVLDGALSVYDFKRVLGECMMQPSDENTVCHLIAAYTEDNSGSTPTNQQIADHMEAPATRLEGWFLGGGMIVPDETGASNWGNLMIQPGISFLEE